MSPEVATKRGMVPVAPFVPLVRERLESMRRGMTGEGDGLPENDTLLAERLEIHRDHLRKISAGITTWIGFDLADRIVLVCTGSAMSWHSEPELHEVYESVDFTWLDAIDEAHRLVDEGVATREVTRVTGISRKTVANMRARAAA